MFKNFMFFLSSFYHRIYLCHMKSHKNKSYYKFYNVQKIYNQLSIKFIRSIIIQCFFFKKIEIFKIQYSIFIIINKL